jgi:hypothetical protein
VAFVHVASGPLGRRVLAAARLHELATTEAEQAAVAGLVASIVRQGVVAESIDVPTFGLHLRVSDDGVLMAKDCVWWPGLLLFGVAPAFGFDQVGKSLEQDWKGTWRVWFVGPTAEVWRFRLRFALALLLCAIARLRLDGLNRERVGLALVIGVIGESAREARWWAPRRALVRWSGREALPADPPHAKDGEATRQLKSFMGLQLLFADVFEAGSGVAQALFRLIK